MKPWSAILRARFWPITARPTSPTSAFPPPPPRAAAAIPLAAMTCSLPLRLRRAIPPLDLGLMPPDVLTALSVSLATLLGLSVLLTLGLRAVRLPGGRPAAAVLGGILAGLVLGPGVLGQLAPDWYEQTFVGGATERRALEELAAERRALVASDVSAEAVREFDRDHNHERQRLDLARRKAMAAFRQPLDVAGVTMLSVAMFAGGWVSPRRRRADSLDCGQFTAV